ncbi:xylulokinase [Tetragenococcus koreensis]|uniref:xylulokinase n=1 Tax=Tetragenococcus koreensis TaxID=290335 RepID=UPI000F4F4CE0|nr:xylulokinase [Tetragenococcus koreensis]AYW46530.1 xylulokinase [Tetragenococcus koreensis]MCF1585354.1 xylulokinase [Tetragenococcus koreensis]MCF1619742.1 xylulokinase [Tetragenococcus koreensis]MCF1629593.1 xylulokinase [Tetragenococcus koreensis]MCF1657225.1 xylulokinase [Tetragenococcus koreensis]
MSYVLGLDLGTSSLKGNLLDETGKTICIESVEYELLNPKSGYNEQNPNDWIQACYHLFGKFSKSVSDFTRNLEGISFSGQMHSLVLADHNGNVLRPAILWNDVRTTKQCKYITGTFGEEILKITKNVVLEGFTLPKILWVQENEPEVWKQVRKIFLPKDYLRYSLTGKFHMDYSDAAGTLLMDIKEKKWSPTILKQYNIPIEYLPKLVNSFEFIGNLDENIKERYGFKNNIKVFAGGADNAVSSLGVGLADPDTAIASIGTSGVFLSLEDSIHDKYKGSVHLFNHVLPNKYYSMGVTLSAGHSVSWFKNLIDKEQSYDKFLSNISDVPIGSNGLLFTPYISGERTPYFDSQIRASFIGLSHDHTLTDLKRAVIEGVTFSLKDSQVLMESLRKKNFNRIISIGGGAKNKEWLQIQADIFNTQVVNLEAEEGPGLGAAMIAAMGLDWFETFEDCIGRIINYVDKVDPIPENVEKYKRIYELYTKVYKSTKSITHKLRL